MSKWNPVGGGSSGASQPAAPSSKRSMRKRKAEVGNSSGAFQPDAPSSKQRRSAASLSVAPGGGASQPVAPGGGASQPAESRESAETLMEAIRKLGRVPKDRPESLEEERKLAVRLRNAKYKGNLSEEHKAELAAMKEQEQEEQSEKSREPVEALMKEIREMGRLPKESRGASEQERSLAEKLRDHKKRGNLSEEHKAELAAMSFKELGELEEVRLEGDPMDPFHEEAANRFEQDLLMALNGIRPKHVMGRIARYKKYMTHPCALGMDLVQKYKEQVLEAAAASDVLPPYVAGCEIQGDALRTFSEEPIMTGPLVCHLCDDATFLYDEDFAKHKEKVHSGENEYRKRVLFLMEQAGNRPVTGQEKRIIVQNFAHFQQFSRPGAKGNTFARIQEEPRREAACVLCQRKDFIEHRHKLNLFGEPPSNHEASTGFLGGAPQPAEPSSLAPEDSDDETQAREQDSRQSFFVKHKGVHYLQDPEGVNALLKVERYAERWPLIPPVELHASSVQHPLHPEWRWLLHVRRVPVNRDADGSPCSAAQPGDERPRCAGIGDENALVWTCWDCLEDIAARKPKMPINACANDNWIGRERVHVREASLATKMLASLGRCCWKQVRLGRHSDPAVQEKALTGNTIFFAQPTADVPSMEMPPPTDALVDSLNVIFTRSLHDLSKAEWAVVDREQYMRIMEERKQQCPVFSHVKVCRDLAMKRLPDLGVPEHITACAREVEGSERAPVHLRGPAARAPETGRDDEAGDASEEHSEDEGCEDRHCGGPGDQEAEASIAVDPIHDLKPVKMMQALQGNIAALQSHAAKIVRNERMARIQDSDGVLQPVVDAGGRENMRALILDVQSTARCFDETAQATVERAIADTDMRLSVCPTALAIPTQAPMDSFNARTWPACYVEWWFGDGAPGLDREPVSYTHLTLPTILLV